MTTEDKKVQVRPIKKVVWFLVINQASLTQLEVTMTDVFTVLATWGLPLIFRAETEKKKIIIKYGKTTNTSIQEEGKCFILESENMHNVNLEHMLSEDE